MFFFFFVIICFFFKGWKGFCLSICFFFFYCLEFFLCPLPCSFYSRFHIGFIVVKSVLFVVVRFLFVVSKHFLSVFSPN